MGGYGSGRRKQHLRTDDCLAIDMAWLRKEKLLSSAGRKAVMQWTKSTITGFHEEKHQEHRVSVRVALIDEQRGILTLSYCAGIPDDAHHSQQEREYTISITLISTPCNYGAVRWWFACPSCYRRVRIVYLPTQGKIEAIKPQCRNCLELHYPSQCQSYIERHKTYERHLLANYGLWWAAHRYDFELKEHYLKMTPELWDLRERSSQLEHLKTLKLLIRCERGFLRDRLRAYRSLKRLEDRQAYLEYMREQERKDKANGIDWIKLLGYSIDLERTVRNASPATTLKNDEAFKAMEDSERDSPDEIEQKLRFLSEAHKRIVKALKKAA